MIRSALIFSLSLLFSLSTLVAQEWQVKPEHPQPGEKMTIHYNPTGGDLEGVKVYAVAYVLHHGELPDVYDLDLKKTDNGVMADFQPAADAQGIIVRFASDDGRKVDDNDGKGYHSFMYKDAKPVENAYAAASGAYQRYADMVGVKGDAEKVQDYFEKEMSLGKADRMSLDYIIEYALVAAVTEDKEIKENILAHIKKVTADSKVGEEGLTKLARAARIVGDKDLNASISDGIKAKFPEGKFAITARFRAFWKIKELDAKLAEYDALKTKYGNDEEYKKSLEGLARGIARDYGKQKDFENMEKYVAMISDGNSVSGIYNSIAWTLSGESIDGEGSDLEYALKITKKSLELAKEEMKTLTNKPDYFSDRQWKRNMKYTIANGADTYALLSYKLGDVKSAVEYQEIACKTNKYKNAELNERYAVYIEKDQGAKAAMGFLETNIEEGHASGAMKAQFQKLFKANVSLDDASAMYLAKLEAKAKAKHVAEIEEGLINEKSPDFALTNLKGEKVSLESLKGKIVIVDFWATWCGPCIASFPGMQKAVNKYEKDEDVAFVFIDTWESAKNKEENAQKFMDGKGYSFNVLMDNENAVVADFGVEGIPTKFILDKEGNIRFRASGFGGNDESLVEEITILIDILRRDGEAAGVTGAQP